MTASERVRARARVVVHEDRCLVLARVPFGESSLVVHVLARGAGRVHLMARGAYRPTSGYCGVLDLFDTLELAWRARVGVELGELSAGRVVARRRHVVRSLDAYRSALSVVELVELAARPGQAAERLFDLATAALDALDGIGSAPRADAAAAADLVRVAFDLAFLDELGLAPALTHCAACGRAAPPPGEGRARTSFAPAAGGRLCRACAARAAREGPRVPEVDAALVDAAAALLAAATAGGPWALEAAVAEGTLVGGRRRALVGLVQRFLEHHLELRPKSRGAPGARGGVVRP